MNDDIVTQILTNTRSRFFLPRERFTGERAKYIELGIFVPTKLHYDYIDCPNGCGEDARMIKVASGSYVAVCNHQSLTESIPIHADQVELYEFDQVAFDRAVKAGRIKIEAIKSPDRPKRRKTMSRSKDWNQQMAADLLGISTRQLRNYAKNPPDDEWPGWEDAILLKQWKNKRDDRDKMNQALAKSIGYKEGYSEAFKKRT